MRSVRCGVGWRLTRDFPRPKHDVEFGVRKPVNTTHWRFSLLVLLAVRRAQTCALLVLGVVGCFWGCQRLDEARVSTPTAPTSWGTSCRQGGLLRTAKCGTIEVLEEPSQPDGRTLSLRVVVIPASESRSPRQPPLFLLAGGPGQGAVAAFQNRLPALEAWGRRRDFVLIDQRGTGESAPLPCVLTSEDNWMASFGAIDKAMAEACRDQLDADLTRYTTPYAADDLDTVRRVLGYPKIALFGASYGTRTAVVYARRYSQRVEALVLDGVVPVNMAFPSSQLVDAQAAFERLDRDCVEACRTVYGSPLQNLEFLMAELKRQNQLVKLKHPRTAVPFETEINEVILAGLVRSMLYASHLSALLPEALYKARSGDWTAFSGAAWLMGLSVKDTINAGLYLSVICSEDVPLIEAQASTSTMSTILGRQFVDDIVQTCKIWPRAKLPTAYYEPLVSSVPTLILSGRLDPATPPRWGEALGQTLERHQHVIVSGAAHGTIDHPCVLRIVTSFLDRDGQLPVDVTCAEQLERPPFFIDFAGPPY